MAYALVQSISVQRTGVTSTTLAYASDLAAGNLAVTAITRWNTTTTLSTISWSVGGSATPVEAISSAAGLNGRVLTHYSPNTSAGPHTLSITWSAAADCSLDVNEYSGIVTSSPLGQTAAASGTGTAVDSGATATLSQANNLVFAAMTHDTGTTALAAGSGYTQREEQENNATSQCISTEDMRVTATTGVNGTFTAAGSIPWRAVVAVYKETPDAPAPIADGTPTWDFPHPPMRVA